MPPHKYRDAQHLADKLDQINHRIKMMEIHLMAKADEIIAAQNELATKLDEATNEVDRDLKALRDELASVLQGGLTAEQATEVMANFDAKFTPISARLTELGKDPANPVPEPAPVPAGDTSDPTHLRSTQ